MMADGRCLLLGPHVSDYIEPNDSSVISLVRSIVKIENRRPLYVIKIDINISILDRIFKELSFHVPSHRRGYSEQTENWIPGYF